jgi:hypothetical protein
MNSHPARDCFGGVPDVVIHVVGTVAGTRVNIHQSGMCGPPGASAWYPLRRRYRGLPRLPDWLLRHLGRL